MAQQVIDEPAVNLPIKSTADVSLGKDMPASSVSKVAGAVENASDSTNNSTEKIEWIHSNKLLVLISDLTS